MTIERVLITGAAGALGGELRRRLKDRFRYLRLSDRAALPDPEQGEDFVRCDLADGPAVEALLADVDAVVHLGGQATEGDWPTVLNSNIVGCYNLWEAARKAGSERILFASSVHAVGLHRRSARLDETTPARPDGRYGLSKAFGEDLACLYAHKHGIKAFCMRIGSCFPAPQDARMLSSWLSYDDFERLVMVGLGANYLYEIVYGASANTRGWWDNARAFALGYAPEDDAEVYAADLADAVSDDPVAERYQGGSFAAAEFTGPESGRS